jgi:uncharacterized protein YyaL (SSP411 family)
VPVSKSGLVSTSRLMARPKPRSRRKSPQPPFTKAFSDQVKQNPAGHSQLMVALEFALNPNYEVVIVCQQFACKLPTTSIDQMLENLRPDRS